MINALNTRSKGVENMTSHPLIITFTWPVLFIGNLLALLHAKAKTIFVVLFCNYLVVQSVIFIKRYLFEIIHIR